MNTSATGGGGGGGSNWVAAASPTVTVVAPVSISGAAGITTAAGALPGKDGRLNIDWLPCQSMFGAMFGSCRGIDPRDL